MGPAWVSFLFFLSASGLSLWQDGFGAWVQRFNREGSVPVSPFGGLYTGWGLCLGLQPLVMCVDNVGLLPTPFCSQLPAREGLGWGNVRSALVRQSGSRPIFVWGPWQGQLAQAVWRRHAWKLISVTLVYFLPSSSVFPWSGALRDNWRAVGRLLVVILVGTGFRRAPSIGIYFCHAWGTVGAGPS